MAVVTRPLADSSTRQRRLLTRVLGWVLGFVLAASPGGAVLDVDLGHYASQERAGLVAVVRGRAYAERRTPDGPEVPLVGVRVVAMPWSDTLSRRLQQLREGARASADAYRQAAALMETARTAYEKELSAAGGSDLVRSTVIAVDGRFELARLPAGRWLIVATSQTFRETAAPRGTRRGDTYARSPRLLGFHTRLVWLREVTLKADEVVDLELTDRSVWFTGVVERRDVGPAPKDR